MENNQLDSSWQTDNSPERIHLLWQTQCFSGETGTRFVTLECDIRFNFPHILPPNCKHDCSSFKGRLQNTIAAGVYRRIKGRNDGNTHATKTVRLSKVKEHQEFTR